MLFLMLFWFVEESFELRPDNLQQLALQAYEQGPGQSLILRAAGMRDAGDRVAPRLGQLSLNVLPEISTRNLERGEHSIQVEADMSMANLPKLRRDVLLGKAATSERQARAERLQWILMIQNLYVEAFLAHELGTHVQELYEAAHAQELSLKEQLEKQLIPQTDWLAQKVLSGSYGHEVREMESRFIAAHRNLEKLMNRPLKLTFPSLQLPEKTDDNPFHKIIEMADPEAVFAEAMAYGADLEARLAMGENAMHLSPNLHYRDEPGGGSWLGMGLKFTWQTGPRKNAAWRMAKTEADSWRSRSKWVSSSKKQMWQARSAHYNSQHGRARAYQDEVLAPLHQQLRLYEEAVKAGHLQRRFYIQASRELHEAEHTFLELSMALWSDRMEARLRAHEGMEEQ